MGSGQRQKLGRLLRRRMKKTLDVPGGSPSRDKARKLMGKARTRGRRRKKCKMTTNGAHKRPVSDYLPGR